MGQKVKFKAPLPQITFSEANKKSSMVYFEIASS